MIGETLFPEKFTVSPKANEFDFVLGFAIDQNEGKPEVTVPGTAPLSGQRMVSVLRR